MGTKVTLGELRKAIRNILKEEAWMPGRYYPGSEPMSPEDLDRLNQPLGEVEDDGGDDDDSDLKEVDTDPSNNPGRPADAASYLGMRGESNWALIHPAAAGGASAPGEAPSGD